MKVKVEIEVVCDGCDGCGHIDIIPATRWNPKEYVDCAVCDGKGFEVEEHEITLDGNLYGETAVVYKVDS